MHISSNNHFIQCKNYLIIIILIVVCMFQISTILKRLVNKITLQQGPRSVHSGVIFSDCVTVVDTRSNCVRDKCRTPYTNTRANSVPPSQTMIDFLSPKIIFTFITNLSPLLSIYHPRQSVSPVVTIWGRAVPPRWPHYGTPSRCLGTRGVHYYILLHWSTLASNGSN